MTLRLFALLLLVPFALGYQFDCLEWCKCDTVDETIHCHNGGEKRDRIVLPEGRLRGYSFIGMTRNNIKVLPSEDMLFDKFPDLTAIDVENNPHFDCSTLDQYRKLQVLSDCGKSPDELNHFVIYDVQTPTSKCDAQCQLRKHYESLHAYVMQLWEVLKGKFHDLKKTKVVTDIHNFFKDVIANIRSGGNGMAPNNAHADAAMDYQNIDALRPTEPNPTVGLN